MVGKARPTMAPIIVSPTAKAMGHRILTTSMTDATSGAPETTPREHILRPAPTPMWVLIPLVLLAITPIIFLSITIGNLRDDVVDDQMFGYFGWRVLHGGTLYLDVWDNKPPGVYWANALGLWMGDGAYLGVTALCGLLLLLGLLSFFYIGVKLFHRDAAALSTVVASFYLTHGWFQAGSNRTETYLVAFELLGLAIYVGAYSKPRWWWWYLSGMVFGIAFLFKQTGLACWGAAGLHTIMLMVIGRLDWKSGIQRGILLTVGVVTTVLIAAGYLASQGALAAAYHAVITFNRGYFAMGASHFPYRAGTMILLKEGAVKVLLMPLLAGIAAIIHAFLCFLRPRLCDPAAQAAQHRPPNKMPGIVFLATVWYLAAVLGALLSPHGFRHYLIPSLSPLLLMFGYLISQLQGEYGLMHAMQRRAWVAMTIVVLFSLGAVALNRQWESFSRIWISRDPQPIDGSWVDWSYNPVGWEVVGHRIAELSQPDETLQCWGYNPGYYLYARRKNICRYTTVEKIGQLMQNQNPDDTGLPEKARIEVERIITDMKQHYTDTPPDWYAMSAGDHLSIFDPEPAENQLGEMYRWVANWLNTNYELVEEVKTETDSAFIYKRRTAKRED